MTPHRVCQSVAIAAFAWGCPRQDTVATLDGSDATVDGVVVVDGTPGLDAAPNDGPIVVREGGVEVIEGDASRVCHITSCAGHVLECGDCRDNDGDEHVDDRDPECLGPCDNTEGAVLLTGVGGETGGPCRGDCYFDFGNGPGFDQCLWDHRCDPLEVPPAYPPEGMSCAYEMSRVGTRDCPVPQTQICRDRCLPLTPNGCDCFGCCTFPGLAGRGPGGGPGYIWLGSRDAARVGTCTLDRVTDPLQCQSCTPVPSCLNSCEPCEICLGRPLPDPSCTMSFPDSGSSSRCAPTVQRCGLSGDADCPLGSYCITGCCQVAPS